MDCMLRYMLHVKETKTFRSHYYGFVENLILIKNGRFP